MPTDPFAPFTTTPDEFWSRYNTWQESMLEHFRVAAEASGMDKAEAEAIIRTAPSNRDLFNVIPYDIAKKLKDSFRKDVLDLDSGYIKESWQKIGIGGGGQNVGRFVPTGAGKSKVSDHPLGYLLRRMSIQKGEGDDIDSYTFGFNIPRVQHLQNLYEDNGKSIVAGKKVFVFDTETLGLSNDASAVREVSGLTMVRGAKGFNVDAASLMTSHMNVSRSAYGAIKDPTTGKVIRMDNFIRKSIVGETSFEHTVGGQGFIKGILPILKQMNEADYIAGHNVGFDIGQVITNAMKTSDYLNNKVVDGVNVKGLVDSIAEKISKGGVIDSLHMASEYFGNSLKLAPEFAKTGKASAFGLENLMLQTNLSSLIEEDDPEFYEKFMSAGQHQADVDTHITAKLIDFISSGRLKAEKITDKTLRRNILSSYALTPISHISDPSHITRELFEQLAQEGGDSLTIRKIGTGGKVPIGPDPGAWYDRLVGGDTEHFASMRVTPLEQYVYDRQKVFKEAKEPESLVTGLGQWNRLSRYGTRDEGFLNRMHTLFKGGYIPDDDVFADFQKSMAKAGMPFSGITMPERILTHGLATAAQRRSTLREMLGDREQRVVDYGDDLGVSRFAMRSEFQTAFSGPAAIPLDILKEAEKANVISTHFLDDKVQMLSLSTIESKDNVNLMVDIGKKDTENLMDWMGKILQSGEENPLLRKKMIDKGLNLATLDRMRASLLEGDNWERGINIGVLEGDAGSQAYATIKDMLQESTRDSTKIPFRVGYMNDSSIGEKGQGIIRTGAVILDRFKSAEAKRAYARDLKVAESRTSKLAIELTNPAKRLRAGLNGYAQAERIAAKSDQIYDIVTKKAPVVAGLAALVFGSYYIHKKHQKQEVYDSSIDPMPLQKGSRRAPRYFPQQTQSNSSALDPLSYAGLVGNLDNNAIGHSQMGSNKNRGLFNGV